MNKLPEATPMTESATTSESEHTRTHRRWANTVFALYGLIVLIGIGATLVHRSSIMDSTPPAMQLKAKATIR